MTPDFAKVFRSLPDICVLLSKDFSLIEATDSFVQVTGCSRALLLGQSALDFFTLSDNAAAITDKDHWLLHITHSPEQKVICDLQFRSSPGKPTAALYNATLTSVNDEHENIQYIICRIEQKKALLKAQSSKAMLSTAGGSGQKLQDTHAYPEHEETNSAVQEIQQDRLQHTFDYAPMGICVMRGPDLRLEYANDAFSSIFDGKRDFLGKPLGQAIAMYPELLEVVHHVLQTDRPYVGQQYPVNMVWNKGQLPYTRYFNFSLIPLPGSSAGQADGLVTYVYEVTELISASKKAEENLSLFKNLVETIPQIVWTGTPDGGVSFFSQRWFDYTQMSYEESKDLGWMKAIHPDDLSQLLARSGYARGTGNVFETQYRLRRGKDGMYRWHLSRSVPVYNTHGRIFLWVGTATDIHDNKVLEEKLEHKNKELEIINIDLDNFVYTASHDLKAPIANMDGLLQALSRTILDHLTPREEHLFEMMKVSVQKLKKTIEDLTEITRIQKAEGLQAEKVSISSIIREVREDIAMLIEISAAEIQEDIRVEEFSYNKSHLRSIVYNLLSNAIKYRSPDRNLLIEISTYREEGYVILSIKDNGLGMSKSQKAKLFTMFKRFHPHVDGTGIGLYMIRRTVENKGGRIEVNSEENRGSSFTVYLKDY